MFFFFSGVYIPIHLDYNLEEDPEDDENVTNWSQWSSWSECTKTCGGGMQIRQRECLEEQAFEVDCAGDVKQLQNCSTDPCPGMCNVFNLV